MWPPSGGGPRPPEDAAPATMTAAQLRPYTGTYRSPERASTDETVREAGRRIARHRRNDDAWLAPAGDDTFHSRQPWLPTVRFRRGPGGSVDAMLVTGSRVRNLRFDRVGGGAATR